MKLPKDSREFIALLNAHSVKYVIVGGYAVAWHGYPRFTGDVDLFVECSPANAAALARVVAEFGLGSLGLKAADFSELGVVIQLGRPPQRIDILTFADGVTFADAWDSRATAVWDGLPVNVLSRELLLANKRASGRAQDIADLGKLE